MWQHCKFLKSQIFVTQIARCKIRGDVPYLHPILRRCKYDYKLKYHLNIDLPPVYYLASEVNLVFPLQSELSHRSDYWIHNNINTLVQLFIQNIYRYISFINSDRNLRTFHYTPGSGQAATNWHISLLRKAGLLMRTSFFSRIRFYYKELK
jgi:hypothetical protein